MNKYGSAERRKTWFGWVRHIARRNADGSLTPYLSRFSLREQKESGRNPWRVYLHKFVAPDTPGHHNHPSTWSFSLILWGSYTEQRFDRPPFARCLPHITTRRVRWFNWLRPHQYHRIQDLHPGPGTSGVWTLFVCGPLTGQGWGFWRFGAGHDPIATK